MNVFKTLWKVFCCDFYAFESMRESVDGEPVLNETHFMLEYIEYSSNVDIYSGLCEIRL